jgi:DNA-binding transcriptional ArsR family regulator
MRIEFSADDIARTMVTSTLGPFAETALGLGSLRMARPSQVPALWRSAAAKVGRPVAELARFVAPRPTVQLDVFSLTGVASTFEEGVESLLTVPDRRLVDEVRAIPQWTEATPTWLRGIESAALPARRRMVGVLAELHSIGVAPYWPAMSAALAAERARLQRALSEGGVDRLLASIHPQVRWRSPVLEVATAGRWAMRPLTSRLDGAGIVICPSVFCPVGPVPYFPHDGTPAVLLYPAFSGSALTRLWADAQSSAQSDGRVGPAGGSTRAAALATLLGRTRAAALMVIADGCTTTELAVRLGVSTASASQHATALRAAGLVSSTRDCHRMLHSLTGLGVDLLNGR